MTRVRTIYLYDDPYSEGLDIGYLAGYLAAELPGVEVGVRTDFITYHLGRFSEKEREILGGELSRQVEGARVKALEGSGSLLLSDVTGDARLGEMYVAQSLQAAMRLLIPEEEADLSHLHIMFTSELVGEVDARTGLRIGVAALGSPNIISTSGLIEAPRLPREYHFRRTQYAMLGAVEHLDELEDQFADRTVGYGDPRVNELLKGYLLIAVAYRATGEGPCPDPSCPLHAAERHRELLEAQVGPESRICRRHRQILDAVASSGEGE